jgi:hypothetical protein
MKTKLEPKAPLLEELDDLEQSLGPEVGGGGEATETPEAGKTEGQQALAILGEIRDLVKQALAPEEKEPEDVEDNDLELEGPPEEEELSSVDKLKGV